MVDVKNIPITPEEMARCIEFSRTSAPTQQAIEFGQHTTQARAVQETARDTLIGKIAEVAFSTMMRENYGIEVPLDFNYYPRGQWDDQDSLINGWRIDVKGTRQGGKWLLVEWNKLHFRTEQNRLSHLYVMFTVGWDRDLDQPTGTACYQGFVTLARLKRGCRDTLVLPRGEVIPGTNIPLQADNFGIRCDHLFSYANDLANILTMTPSPALTDHYRSPYADPA